MTDIGWIELALTAARPQALGALLRYFRDLDTAEEAFQEACLRAIRTWPDKGAPRDPAAWLIFVGRNSGVDQIRKRAKNEPLPEEAAFSDLSDAEEDIADRLDNSHYRDDILRLMFICCHPELPNTQQIALSLRIVSGLTVPQIANAFLVSDAAMEQRITRAKARIAKAQSERRPGDKGVVGFETPDAYERAARLKTVAAMIYLVFNEGYSSGVNNPDNITLCEEAIRLVRILLRIFPSEPEIMGLATLMLLQHARAAARFDEAGQIILLENQDRSLWDTKLIAEALAMLDKAVRHKSGGPYQLQAAIAALHARAEKPEDTDWWQIDLLYQALEHLQPSPVVTLNRAVAVSKAEGPEEALALIATVAAPLDGYFYFHGVRGGLLMQAGQTAEAREAFDRAIGLANSPAEAAHIRMQIDRLGELRS
ncbi:sigma-70 family RNA polymerase sigma factor [Rhizobiales bacterium RZME27]|uniref:Sigma-70 family RNA polymerase sigma factor n=1 Tax=Endobacterium cereale TaxID=2663029 RepID=A0A6A8AEM5_9HYPH|nr:RNA polymerase sigma factor [Endobacterium cereale]MEB2842961.1 RNA polymerase sigma factor [Endobacterium cereale]MQY49783.1 sigma-70 family RNA polymerase sigma factor [Endobacterium cereale]